MSISFSCECGKKLAAKDNFAGRRLKCPGCGKSLTIPQHRAVVTQLASAGASATQGKVAGDSNQGYPHGQVVLGKRSGQGRRGQGNCRTGWVKST